MKSNGKSTNGSGKANGSTSPRQGDLFTKKSWWQEKAKYGHGTHGLLFNAQIFDPEFLNGLFTWNEIGFGLTLTFKCIKDNDWRILATESFLQEALAGRGNGSSGSIKRFKTKWIEAGFLDRVNYGGLSGNDYIMSTILTIPHVASEMGHFQEAHMLTVRGMAKLKKDKAAAEAEMRRLEASRRKQEREWLAACKDAEARGLPTPESRNFVHC